MKSFIRELALPVMAIVSLSVMLALTPTYFIGKLGCFDYASVLNVDSSFSLTTGCLIKTKEGWIKADKYIIIHKEEK